MINAFESVSQFETKFYTFFGSCCTHILDNLHAIYVFEIMPKSLVGHSCFEAEAVVKNVAKLFGAEQSRVHLYGGVVAAFFDQIHGDFFNFVGWAAMHG